MIKASKSDVCRSCTDERASVARTSMNIGDGASLELVNTLRHVSDMLSVDGDADAAVKARVCKGRNKFRQLVPLLMRQKLYRSCVCTQLLYNCCLLHGSKTWPVEMGAFICTSCTIFSPPEPCPQQSVAERTDYKT